MRRAHSADISLFSLQMYGKWFDIAIGTTCKWMKNYKEKFIMGTLVLGPGPSADQISTTSTRLRYGALLGALLEVFEPPPKPPHAGMLPLSGAGTDTGVTCSVWHPSPEEGLDWAQIPHAWGSIISGILHHGLGAPDMIFLP